MKRPLFYFLFGAGLLCLRCGSPPPGYNQEEELNIEVFASSPNFYFDEIIGTNGNILPPIHQRIKNNIVLVVDLPIDKSQSSCGYIFKYQNVYDTLLFEYKRTTHYHKKEDIFSMSITDLRIAKHTFQNAVIITDHWSDSLTNTITYAKIFY